jgi:hypothetical protein
MSRENVEVVRAAWEAWERADMEALFEVYDPAIVWDQTHYGTVELGGVYHGHEGVRQFFREWLAPFAMKAEDFLDAGETVVVRVRQEGRGIGSGAPSGGLFWFAFTLRGGRVTRFDMYATEAEALEAVGFDSRESE